MLSGDFQDLSVGGELAGGAGGGKMWVVTESVTGRMVSRDLSLKPQGKEVRTSEVAAQAKDMGADGFFLHTKLIRDLLHADPVFQAFQNLFLFWRKRLRRLVCPNRSAAFRFNQKVDHLADGNSLGSGETFQFGKSAGFEANGRLAFATRFDSCEGGRPDHDSLDVGLGGGRIRMVLHPRLPDFRQFVTMKIPIWAIQPGIHGFFTTIGWAERLMWVRNALNPCEFFHRQDSGRSLPPRSRSLPLA